MRPLKTHGIHTKKENVTHTKSVIGFPGGSFGREDGRGGGGGGTGLPRD